MPGSPAQDKQVQSKGTAADKLQALLGRVTRRVLQQEQKARKKAEHEADKAARKGRRLHERAVAAAQHPLGFAVLASAATYVTLRGGIEVFHRTRRALLRSLLLDVCEALEKLAATFWLDFGCLLGIHREGDLILHDNDVDLAVLNPDWPALLEGLKRNLPPNKYSLKVVTPEGHPESSWIRVYCPLGMCDLFGAYSAKAEGQGEQEEGSEIYVDCGHGDTMHIARDLVLPTGRKPWRGVNLSVPRDVEGTLERRYGPDWRTPAYADKGADTVEGNKPYIKLFRLLARLGLRL